MIDQLRELLPGVALCIAITIAAILLQGVEVRFAGQAYLEALVLALLLGVALRTAWKPGPRWDPGIRFSAKTLLEVAIVMLGASVSATTIFALGPVLIFGIAGIVAVAIGTSYAICRALGLHDGDRPETDAVARKVIEFAQRGVSDRVDLREKVLQELS